MELLRYAFTAVIVLAVLFATYRGMGAWSRRRVVANFREPDDILAAARIYESYNRPKAAIELLEAGLVTNPGHAELEQKLEQLRRGSKPV